MAIHGAQTLSGVIYALVEIAMQVEIILFFFTTTVKWHMKNVIHS